MNVAIRGIDGRIAQGDVSPVRNANFAWVQHIIHASNAAYCLPHTTCRLHVRP
ncbi:MAG TPA: hypothetical protein GXX55_04290 [Firmicutes bacterium]|nr:hypothetical protein [Bacillota bacterium]